MMIVFIKAINRQTAVGIHSAMHPVYGNNLRIKQQYKFCVRICWMGKSLHQILRAISRSSVARTAASKNVLTKCKVTQRSLNPTTHRLATTQHSWHSRVRNDPS